MNNELFSFRRIETRRVAPLENISAVEARKKIISLLSQPKLK
jgi:hypothetical protein